MSSFQKSSCDTRGNGWRLDESKAWAPWKSWERAQWTEVAATLACWLDLTGHSVVVDVGIHGSDDLWLEIQQETFQGIGLGEQTLTASVRAMQYRGKAVDVLAAVAVAIGAVLYSQTFPMFG